MKKYLIILFVLIVLVPVLFAASIQDKHRAVITTKKEAIFFERFGTNPGYDETAAGIGGNWSETVGATSTVDEDESTLPATAPSSWGSEWLQIIHAASERADTLNTLDTSYSKSYWLFDFIITAEGLADNNNIILARLYTGGGSVVAYIALHQAASQLYFRISAAYDSASPTAFLGSCSVISLDTYYIVKVRWDADLDTWDWYVDGVRQPNNIDSACPIESEGTLTGAHPTNIGRVMVGDAFGDADTVTYYMGHVEMNPNRWPQL